MHVLPFLILFVEETIFQKKKNLFSFSASTVTILSRLNIFLLKECCWAVHCSGQTNFLFIFTVLEIQTHKYVPTHILSIWEKVEECYHMSFSDISVVQLQYILIFTWRLKGKDHLSMSATLEFVWNHAISKTFDKIFITFNCRFKNGSNWKSSTFFE